jgi:hypothetical protein
MIASDLRVSLSSDGGGTFVDEINARHRNINGCVKTALAEAIRIGELLTANKAAVRHGDWLRWIEKNLEFDRTTAFRYMRIFERRDELKCFSVQHLTEAYALLAEKTDREPAPAKDEKPEAVATDSKPAAKQKPKSVEDEIPTAPEETDEARWRRGLLDRAQAAVNGAAYHDWWSKYTFDDEVIDAATQAAEAWQNLVTFFNRNSF